MTDKEYVTISKKLGMEIKTIEYQGCYFLTEKGQIKSVKIPYKKVVEKDCISIVDNYTYNFKQAKIRHKKNENRKDLP